MSENLQQTLALLNQQRDNLKQLLDSLSAGVVLADNQGKIRYLNESSISLLAMPKGSYVGKPFVGVIGIARLIELYDRLKETPESEHILIFLSRKRNTYVVRAKALGNVIDNAIKYTRRKYGEKEGGMISVSLSDGGRWWRISISDNGVGISPDILSNIFDRFQRSSTDNIRQKGEMTGFGLGLAIAKNIIEAHNGLIEVTSEREPTTFTINIPKMKE